MQTPLKILVAGLLAIPILFGLVHSTPTRSTHVLAEAFITLEQEPSASIIEVGPHYKTDRMFLSEIYEADYAFQLLGLNWQAAIPEGTAATMEIRFRSTEGTWTAWEPLEQDNDQPSNTAAGLWTYVITQNSDAFQYRASLSTSDTTVTPKLSDVSFDYVDGGKTSPLSKLEKMIFKNDNEVISRDDWGADESLRLSRTHENVELSSEWESELSDEDVDADPDMRIVDTVAIDEDGNQLLWPEEYPAKVKKIIIHHTATTANLDDPETSIRAIYYYHAITRGWGDIGYNFIVAPDGSVFEGRAGGDGVVAGHASGYNTGSVGIALLGNYEEDPISGEMMQALTALIYEKAELHDIDPDDSGVFRGKSMSNILGHRDVDSTACPGIHTYDYLDAIRSAVANAIDAQNTKDTSKNYAFEEVGNRELITLDPEEDATVTVKIKNTGSKTWNSDTYLVVNANSDSDDLVSIPKDSKKRTAKMKESSVGPGKTATFSFEASATLNGGLAEFDMSPVFNGSEKTKHYMDLGLFVEQPYLKFSTQSDDAPDSLKPGSSATVTVKIRNDGNLTWEKSGDRTVTLLKSGSSSLTSSYTLATLTESSVAPGKTASFTFTIKAPTKGGTYTLDFYPEMKNSNAITSSAGQISLKVMDSKEDALVAGTSDDLSFEPGEKKTVWVQVKNTSTSTWSSTGSKAFSLAFTKPKGLTTGTQTVAFKNLKSGSSGKISFDITAPETAGEYTLEVRPRLGSTNLTNSAYPLKITVGDSASEDFTVTDYENPIRIKLTPSDAVVDPVFSSKSSFALYDNEELIKVFTADSRVRITPGTSDYTASFGSNKWTLSGPVRFVPEEDGIMKVLTMNEQPSWDTSINYNQFRGTMEVNRVDGTTILINELPLEEYVMGSAEETNTTPTEKLKTMAILYRTYAYYYITQAEKFPGMPYDGEDDPATFQKYLGYSYESKSPNIVSSVEDTKGMVVTYKGKVVKTPYFSKSDGVATKSAEDVWGWTNTPWLISVDDPYCDSTAFSGHGVGLSGCGAFTLAEDGWTFEEIIKYYYTGVEISTL